MEYITVFNISEQEINSVSYTPLLFTLIGIIFLLIPKLISPFVKKSVKFIRIFGLIFFGFSLLGSIGIPKKIIDKQSKTDLLNQGKTKVIEGTVQNFSPMPKSGKAMESFDVSGIHFEYSKYTLINGFNKTAIEGGPINKNGQKVRLSYITEENENFILKVEIAK